MVFFLQIRYLIVSIPDLCLLPHINSFAMYVVIVTSKQPIQCPSRSIDNSTATTTNNNDDNNYSDSSSNNSNSGGGWVVAVSSNCSDSYRERWT